MARVVLDWKTVAEFVEDAFVGVGVPRDDARICTDGPVFNAADVDI